MGKEQGLWEPAKITSNLQKDAADFHRLDMLSTISDNRKQSF
jgi:hypothetical protein